MLNAGAHVNGHDFVVDAATHQNADGPDIAQILNLNQAAAPEPTGSTLLLEQLNHALATVTDVSRAAAAAAETAEREFSEMQTLRRSLAAKVAEFESMVDRRIRAITRFNAEVDMLKTNSRRLFAAVSRTVPIQTIIPKSVHELVKKRTELVHLIREASALVDCALALPQCGIYFLLNDGEIVYVGQSVNVVARISQHAVDSSKVFNACCYFPTERAELDDLERALIVLLRPRLNVRGKPPPQAEHSTELFGT